MWFASKCERDSGSDRFGRNGTWHSKGEDLATFSERVVRHEQICGRADSAQKPLYLSHSTSDVSVVTKTGLTATAQRHSAPTTTHLQRVCDPWLQTKVRKPYSEIKQRSNSVDEHVPQTVPEEKTVTYTSVSVR